MYPDFIIKHILKTEIWTKIFFSIEVVFFSCFSLTHSSFYKNNTNIKVIVEVFFRLGNVSHFRNQAVFLQI